MAEMSDGAPAPVEVLPEDRAARRRTRRTRSDRSRCRGEPEPRPDDARGAPRPGGGAGRHRRRRGRGPHHVTQTDTGHDGHHHDHGGQGHHDAVARRGGLGRRSGRRGPPVGGSTVVGHPRRLGRRRPGRLGRRGPGAGGRRRHAGSHLGLGPGGWILAGRVLPTRVSRGTAAPRGHGGPTSRRQGDGPPVLGIGAGACRRRRGLRSRRGVRGLAHLASTFRVSVVPRTAAPGPSTSPHHWRAAD